MKGERRILSRTTLACSTDITVVAPSDRVTRPAVVGSTVVSLTFARCSVELAAAQPPPNSHTAGACSSQLIVVPRIDTGAYENRSAHSTPPGLLPLIPLIPLMPLIPLIQIHYDVTIPVSIQHHHES